jgi:hypothetical protein
MANNQRLLTQFLFAGLISSSMWLASCNTNTNENGESETTTNTKLITNPTQHFNADSSFTFIEKQLSFGFRIPGTPEHKKCSEWLVSKLGSYVDTAFIQTGSATTFDGKKIPVYNIIGSIHPQAKKRMLLMAHWDSRPFADQDTDDQTKPIEGANDGASGVAVLLELARNSKLQKLPNDVGVDIIFFDAEDWGNSDHENSFCLGSQYWGKNLHTPGYSARFGVLLDMVGGKNAEFLWEANSNEWGNTLLQHVWTAGQELGYGNYFKTVNTHPVIDDHVYVYKATKIPTIDIIHYTSEGGFTPEWHTHQDNISNIDKNTLKAVGHTLENVIAQPPASFHY